MTDKRQPRTDVRDPNTGEAMVVVTEQTAAALSERITRNAGVEQGAQRVTRTIQEKEDQFGYLYRNPRTGYQARVPHDGPLPWAKGGDRSDRSDATGARSDQAVDDRELAAAREVLSRHERQQAGAS